MKTKQNEICELAPFGEMPVYTTSGKANACLGGCYAAIKKLSILFLLTLLSNAHAGEAEIRKSLQSQFPTIGKLEHIVKTPYSGLYEIVVGDQLLYTDAQGQFLFDGHIIETKNRRNITEERQRQIFAIEFDKLPFELAIKKVKGNGKRKMAYFTDPFCGYCKRLEKELAKVTDVTLYIFLHPLQPGADEISRNILCSKNQVKSWDDLMLNNTNPPAATCETPIDKIMALSKKLHVNGTPNLIFGNGVQNPGYLPAEELEKRLNEAGGK